MADIRQAWIGVTSLGMANGRVGTPLNIENSGRRIGLSGKSQGPFQDLQGSHGLDGLLVVEIQDLFLDLDILVPEGCGKGRLV